MGLLFLTNWWKDAPTQVLVSIHPHHRKKGAWDMFTSSIASRRVALFRSTPVANEGSNCISASSIPSSTNDSNRLSSNSSAGWSCCKSVRIKETSFENTVSRWGYFVERCRFSWRGRADSVSIYARLRPSTRIKVVHALSPVMFIRSMISK